MDLARGFGWLVVSAAIVTVGWPTPARACSCDFSGPGRFYLGVDGKLPRDALGIPWSGPNALRPSEYETRPITDRVVLLRHVDGREVAAPFTIVPRGRIDLIVPKGGMRPGDTFTVLVREYGWDAPFRRYRGPARRGKAARREPPLALPYELTATVTVTADEPALQGATIELSRRSKRMVEHAQFRPPACSGERESDTIDLTTVLPPALEPYRNYLLYETRVDDVPRDDQQSNCVARTPGRSWMREPGTDLLFSECGEEVDGLLAPLSGDYLSIARAGLGRRAMVSPSPSPRPTARTASPRRPCASRSAVRRRHHPIRSRPPRRHPARRLPPRRRLKCRQLRPHRPVHRPRARREVARSLHLHGPGCSRRCCCCVAEVACRRGVR